MTETNISETNSSPMIKTGVATTEYNIHFAI